MSCRETTDMQHAGQTLTRLWHPCRVEHCRHHPVYSCGGIYIASASYSNSMTIMATRMRRG